MWISKIISGGQTGVDRGALDFAMKKNIPCGGWCPAGRLSENGKIPEIYPLQEAATDSYKERTELNVLDSDGTLVIINGNIGNGTDTTIEYCIQHQRPYMVLNLNENIRESKERFENWVMKHNVKILNIAGNRESTSPGIYMQTMNFLNGVFQHLTVS